MNISPSQPVRARAHDGPAPARAAAPPPPPAAPPGGLARLRGRLGLRARGRLARRLRGWGFLALLLVLWEIAGRQDTTGLLPPVGDVLKEVGTIVTGDGLTHDVLPSIARALAGFAAGSVVGILLGVALGWWRWLDPWLRPSLEFLRAVPPPALVPLAVVAFGASTPLRIAVIAAGTCWPVLLSTTDGVRRVEPGFVETARVYTPGGSLTVLRRVVVPAALPQIMNGLRIGLAVSLIVMVISEMVASSSGLGFLILQSQRMYAMTPMYAGVLLLALAGWLLTLTFSAVERRALSWFDGMKGRDHD
ncbi:ABC transporter permease [Streptomyces sp. NPDC058204]|uniref:ABC transporter permease n=2 Tax=Streptomyces TaxID=1883 RepID=UPI003654E649